MSRFDRYVLSQYLLFFGFFALILVAVMWINRAVVLFDKLIGGGQSAMVFLEFTALSLPNLIRMVLPMAAFAATVFVTNRLIGESELTVMQATGTSPWRLARPALLFGLIAAGMMSLLTHVLLPASLSQLAIREKEVSRNVAAKLLSEGRFLHPAHGVTFYIGKIDPDGTLRDVLLSDSRDPQHQILYTGAEAFLVRDADAANLIIVDGLAQRLDTRNRLLSTTFFSDFSYDISSLVRDQQNQPRNPSAIPTLELLTKAPQLARDEGLNLGKLIEVLNQRFARALTCIAVALVGFSALQLGTFSRFGLWRQILLAFLVIVALEIMRGALAEPVRNNIRLWPLIYLPTATGIGLSLLFLRLAGRPLPFSAKRAPATTEAEAP